MDRDSIVMVPVICLLRCPKCLRLSEWLTEQNDRVSRWFIFNRCGHKAAITINLMCEEAHRINNLKAVKMF